MTPGRVFEVWPGPEAVAQQHREHITWWRYRGAREDVRADGQKGAERRFLFLLMVLTDMGTAQLHLNRNNSPCIFLSILLIGQVTFLKKNE